MPSLPVLPFHGRRPTLRLLVLLACTLFAVPSLHAQQPPEPFAQTYDRWDALFEDGFAETPPGLDQSMQGLAYHHRLPGWLTDSLRANPAVIPYHLTVSTPPSDTLFEAAALRELLLELFCLPGHTLVPDSAYTGPLVPVLKMSIAVKAQRATRPATQYTLSFDWGMETTHSSSNGTFIHAADLTLWLLKTVEEIPAQLVKFIGLRPLDQAYQDALRRYAAARLTAR